MTDYRYEAYDGFNCRLFVGKEIQEEEKNRQKSGYSWFENYTILKDTAEQFKLGDGPSIQEVREAWQWEQRNYGAPPDEYHIAGYEIVEKVAKAGGGTSTRIFLPRSWEGKRVKIVRIDP